VTVGPDAVELLAFARPGIPLALERVPEEAPMAQTLAAFGLYPSTRALHVGAEALREARFRQTDISVMYSDGSRALQLRESRERPSVADDEPEPESLGHVLSGLSGIGAVRVSDEEPFMAGGPILATLTSTSDSLSQSLRGLGIPEVALSYFEGKLKQGGLLLTVQCDDDHWAVRAQRILEDTGAEHVAASSATVMATAS
jgi:hypothetical protein